MSDLHIPDIASTSTLWNDPDRTFEQLNENIKKVSAALQKMSATDLYTSNYDEFTKEAADVLLILYHIYAKKQNGQAFLFSRYLNFIYNNQKADHRPTKPGWERKSV